MGDNLDAVEHSVRPQARAEAVRRWITELENGIASAPHDSFVPSARWHLAWLYMEDGQPAEAVDVIDRVIAEGRDPGLLMTACLDAAAIAIRAGRPIDESLSYTEHFMDLVDAYRTAGEEYPSYFDGTYGNINLVQANLLAVEAEWIRHERPDGSAPELAATAGALLAEAAALMFEHVERLAEAGRIDELPDALITGARYSAEAAALFDAARWRDEGRALRINAIDGLERLVEEFPRTRLTLNAASLLLREKFLVRESLDSYVDDARVLAEKITPGHEYLSFLRAEALELSRDPATLVAANALFDLVIELEQRWFGDEFRQHVNYQWALLGGTRNSLKMGDLDDASRRLTKLARLELRGDYFQDQFVRLEKAHRQSVANRYNSKLTEDAGPTDDVEPADAGDPLPPGSSETAERPDEPTNLPDIEPGPGPVSLSTPAPARSWAPGNMEAGGRSEPNPQRRILSWPTGGIVASASLVLLLVVARLRPGHR